MPKHSHGRILRPARFGRSHHQQGHRHLAAGLGWPYATGLWTGEQIAGWRRVTDATHAAGGHIIAQLWHMGRVVHPSATQFSPRPFSAVAAALLVSTQERGLSQMLAAFGAELPSSNPGNVSASMLRPVVGRSRTQPTTSRCSSARR